MKLSNREKVLLISFFIMGLGYFYYTFFYSPIQTKTDMLAEENKALQSQIKSIADNARQNSGIVHDAQGKKLQERFQDQVIKVPGEIMLPEALLYLQKSARTSRVTMISLAFTPEAATAATPAGTNMASAHEVKITLTAKGGYSGLKAFLLKIHEAPRLYRVDTVKMLSSSGTASAEAPVDPASAEDNEAGTTVPPPADVKNEITMNVNMVTFFQEVNVPGFKDNQERLKPGPGQDNPFAI